jgi:hypothetical protein
VSDVRPGLVSFHNDDDDDEGLVSTTGSRWEMTSYDGRTKDRSHVRSSSGSGRRTGDLPETTLSYKTSQNLSDPLGWLLFLLPRG